MAKNISLMGASYSDVPAVVLPQTGGGTARFDDASVTTATASDVAQGKIFLASDGTISTGTASGGGAVVQPLSVTTNGTYTAPSGVDGYSPVTVNVSGGGGGEAVSRSDVNFYDYDGTLLYSFTTAEVNDSGFTMPSNPSHTGLTAQGWNWTLAQLRTQLTAMPTQAVDVGQMYITDDGKTRLYCHFEEGRLHPYLGIGVNGTVVVDWGDGSAASTLTGTSLTTAKVADHVYASGGDYMITLTVTSGSAQILGNSSTTYLLRKANNTTQNIHRVYSNALVKVELGTGIGVGKYAFCFCSALTNITIPSGMTSIGPSAFYYCYSLTNITIPSGVTSIGGSAFRNCSSLTSVTIPSGMTEINPSTFQYCSSLANVTISSGVTIIGTNAFNADYGLGEIHFKPTTPPTVGNAAAWTNVPTDCVIYVPTGTLSAYTSAANYPSSSTYTYVEE